MTSTAPSPDRPFSRTMIVADLPAKGRDIHVAANEAERAGLAVLLRLQDVAALEADLAIRRFGRDGAAVEGQLKARVSQVSVVSGDIFEQEVKAPVAIRFSPDGVDPNASVAIEDLISEAEDPPDLLIDGRIDLGAIVAEFLALALDPYPRKPGETFAASEAEPASNSPFAGLIKLTKSD